MACRRWPISPTFNLCSICAHPDANLCVPATLMLATGMNGLVHCLEGLYSKVRTPGLGVPSRLRDLGVTQAQLGPVAAQVMHERGLFFNPRPVAHAGEIEQLLAAVW